MSNPLPESKGKPAAAKKNPKLILYIGLAFIGLILFVVIFAVIKVVTKGSGDQDQMKPVAEQQPNVVASEVSATPFTPAEPDPNAASAPANAEIMQKLEEMSQAQTQIRMDIYDLNIAIKAQAVAQEQSTKAMKDYVQAIIEQRRKEMKAAPSDAATKKPIINPAPLVPSRPQAQVKQVQSTQWHVSSSVGERIWISNGERDISLALGDQVEGAGNVVQIDFPNRAVYFSSGLRIGPKVNP